MEEKAVKHFLNIFLSICHIICAVSEVGKKLSGSWKFPCLGLEDSKLQERVGALQSTKQRPPALRSSAATPATHLVQTALSALTCRSGLQEVLHTKEVVRA